MLRKLTASRWIAAVAAAGVCAEVSSTTLQVTPAEGLVDQTPEITLSGTRPGERVRVIACITDDAGTIWRARADYFADAVGRVEVGKTAAVEGTYVGIDPRGLFWSMLPLQGDASNNGAESCPDVELDIPFHNDPLEPVEVKFEALILEGYHRTPRKVAQARYRMLALAAGVRRSAVHDGRLRGLLFEPAHTQSSTPAALVLTGSGGGVNASSAALLASYGITALALAYFNYEDLPKEQIEIPLEYFQEGMGWLARRTQHSQVALVGASRGGEGVLLIASTFPQLVAAVVAQVPVQMVYGGVAERGTYTIPGWTLEGKALPYVPADVTQVPARAETYRSFYLDAWSPELETRYGIAVEKIEAPILLLSARADDLWPSTIGSERVVARLTAHHFHYPFEHVAYEGAGHGISHPGTIVFSHSGWSYHPVVHELIPLGGYPAANSAATIDAFRRTRDWIVRYGGGRP